MDEKAQLAKFGRHLRRLRLKKGWTQAEAAEKAELSPNYYGEVERGERNIAFVNLCRLAHAFKLSLSKLVKY